MKRIHEIKRLKAVRKELRNKLTPAEAYLWNHLKRKKLQGRKFRRQHSIENYIVDFYCYEERLVVELDGEIHNNANQQEYDDLRTQRLKELGNTVLRFENKMVFDNLLAVLTEITDNFDK